MRLKSIQSLPPVHIVERYLETVKPLGVVNDNKGLDFFIAEKDEVDTNSFFNGSNKKFVALVLGGSYFTKQIPINKLKEICRFAKLPLVLLGDKNDNAIAIELLKEFPALTNTCGKYNLGQCASVLRQAEWVITPDTGLMHIASAFHKKIISIWGNTIPQFGMEPYQPNENNLMIEIKDLSCRPCSKLGYKKCPKGHFKCMSEIDFGFVKQLE